MAEDRRGIEPRVSTPAGSVVGPSVGLPEGAASGLPGGLGATRIGPVTFKWRTRTYLMGILNLTPDSFSGDGLLAREPAIPGSVGVGRSGVDRSGADLTPIERAVLLARSMVEEGADLVDVGGESTRPGHEPVDLPTELARVVPVVEAVRRALPDLPLSIDTTKVAVAEAALEAGANLINDVWGVAEADDLERLAGESGVPIVLMHNRAEARYVNLMAEVIADLERAIERALRAGVVWDDILIDPGFGFGKAPIHNLALLRELSRLQTLGRPIVLGTSRKSSIGVVLGVAVDDRLEGTLATTALAIAGGVDIVRVHDVRANARVARMSDAIVRVAHP